MSGYILFRCVLVSVGLRVCLCWTKIRKQIDIKVILVSQCLLWCVSLYLITPLLFSLTFPSSKYVTHTQFTRKVLTLERALSHRKWTCPYVCQVAFCLCALTFSLCPCLHPIRACLLGPSSLTFPPYNQSFPFVFNLFIIVIVVTHLFCHNLCVCV